MYLVGWNKIIKPKEQGGLGIQYAKEKNIALIAKLNWQMHQEKVSHGLSKKQHQKEENMRNKERLDLLGDRHKTGFGTQGAKQGNQ